MYAYIDCYSIPALVVLLLACVGCNEEKPNNLDLLDFELDEVEFTPAPLVDLGEERRFIGHESPVRCLAVSPDGKWLLSGCGQPGTVNGRPIEVKDRSIRLWDLQTGKELRKMVGHTDTVYAVAFSPDGTKAVSGGSDGTIRIWDLETGQETKRITGHATIVNSVGYFSDGQRIYSAGTDSTVWIWDVKTGTELRRFGPMVRAINAVALSVDESAFFAGGTIGEIWNRQIESGKLVDSFKQRGKIHSLAVSPTQERLIVSTSHIPIKLIDTETGDTLVEFEGHTSYEVYCSRFTSDGQRFASCGGDRTLRIWDAESGEQLGLVEGFPDGLNAVVVTPDDKHVIAAGGGRYPGSYDYTIRMWSLSRLKD
jgi:WD40 repeat protein